MLLFERIKGQPIKFGELYKGAKRSLEQLLLEHQLFLSKAVENKVVWLGNDYSFLTSVMVAFQPMDDWEELSLKFLLIKRLLKMLLSDFRTKLNHLISALDTGVKSLRVEVNQTEFHVPDGFPSEVRQYLEEMNKYRIKTQSILAIANLEMCRR